GLAALLFHGTQRRERPLRHKAGLLGEFAHGRRQLILARIDQPLRDRPGAGIFLGPERPARMGEQHFELFSSPIDEQACADLRLAAHVTAAGAIASMSVTTSITAGRFAANACASAGAKSAGFSTRIPSAPMSSAILAKLTDV